MKKSVSLIVAGLLLLLFVASAYATRSQDVSGNAIITNTITAAIAISTTTSAEFDLEDYSLVGLVMPAAFTGTAVTFTCAATSGGTFNQVDTDSGAQLSWTVAAARSVQPATPLGGFRFCKIVSGSTETAARTISLVLGR